MTVERVTVERVTVERVTGIEPALSAWEVCGAAALPPADSVTCGDLDGLSLSDRDYPRALLLSGTQRARPASRGLAHACFLIIPEPERPRRRPGIGLTAPEVAIASWRTWAVDLAGRNCCQLSLQRSFRVCSGS